ncbi:ribosomal-protein-alanine N-acetyltransferase [Pseudoalteromonas luteoviolacea]|uniref:[Ribosomal protein bS18]-alanine N-acetyltransferase n=1 Tax=Pseudoalteromonas luteoviolacea TaxID=43657 RepID=A0A1C0TP85_9GAMM|nr:ribosomal protein S18-alanine N-acetyltransferase [Pseudoalteromonas luteoviolacea]OCQ20751.1 ribosomal-protein-alanine N-acetyltransferase [Pseudoalteromonas luteoviolacea]
MLIPSNDFLSQHTMSDIMAVEVASHPHPWSEKTLASCIGGRYFNASLTCDGELIGYYIAERAGPDYTLMNICVHPQKQGQGLATLLMQSLIQRCIEEQAENLFLEVRASNTTAIALYEKMGLTIMGKRKHYYPTIDGKEDAILMGLQFAAQASE